MVRYNTKLLRMRGKVVLLGEAVRELQTTSLKFYNL